MLAHKYDKDGKNYASRHRNPDFDFEWACVSICIFKGEEIREAIKTFDLDQYKSHLNDRLAAFQAIR